jgi:hypothetical protein
MGGFDIYLGKNTSHRGIFTNIEKCNNYKFTSMRGIYILIMKIRFYKNIEL